MAELGNIQVTDTNRGIAPVDRRSELDALNTSLSLADKVVTEAAEADLRGDLRETAKEAIEKSDALAKGPDLDVFAPEEGDDEITSFVKQMKRHQAIANQARETNSKTRAQLAMQRELASAKQKYPWLRDELNREAANFMATSPELTALGLRDSEPAGGTQQYSNEVIEGIKKRAYGTGDLDYKIDPSVEFGTPAFAREYQKASMRIAARVDLAEREALAKAKDQVDARELANIWQEQIQGPNGDVQTMYDEINRQIQPVYDARMRHARGEMSDAALAEIEDEWQRVVVKQLDRQIEQAMLAARASFDETWSGNLANTPQAEKLRTQLNSVLSNMQVVRDSISGDDLNIAEFLKTQSVIRGQRKLEGQEVLGELVDLFNVAPTDMLNFISQHDMSFTSLADRHLISQGLQGDLRGMFPSMAGAWGVDRGDDPDAKRAARDRELASADAPLRVGSRDPNTVKADARGTIENVAQRVLTPQLYNPEFNRAGINEISQAIGANHMFGPALAEEDLKPMRSLLADPEFLTYIDEIPNGKNSADVQEMTARLEEEWFNGKADDLEQWANGIIQKGSEPFLGGSPITMFVTVDETSLATDGSIGFHVSAADEKRIRQATREAFSIPGEDLGRAAAANKTLADQKVREARQLARQLTTEVTQFTRVTAHLDYLRMPTYSDPQYLEAFMGVGGANDSMNRLFDVFRTE